MAKQAAEEERGRRRKPFENRKQALLESHPAGFELQTEAHRVRSISPYRRRGSRQTPLFTRWRVLSFLRSQGSSWQVAVTTCGMVPGSHPALGGPSLSLVPVPSRCGWSDSSLLSLLSFRGNPFMLGLD